MKRRAYEKIYKSISVAVVVALLAGSVSAATPVTVRANVSQPEEVMSANAVDTTEEQSEKVNGTDLEIQSEAAVQDDIPRALTYRDVEDPVPVMKATDGVIYANRGSLPTTYNSIEAGKVPALRDQGSYGTCWAFAAIGASEASAISQGKADTSIDLSERHLAYFFYNKGETGDAIGGTTGDYNSALEDTYYSAGGNSLFTMWHLASWAGMVDETVAPYEDIATELTNTTEAVYDSSSYHLQNAYIINKSNTDEIKRTIMEYGAMAASYYSVKASNYDRPIEGDYGAYYYNVAGAGTNHAIQIIGWDDEYSADNFAITPEGDGAWLVKNSWGEELENERYAQRGYFWISYYDTSLTTNFYAFISEPADNYDNIYQYDGASGIYYYSTYGAANVFEVQANNGRMEILRAVGIGNYSNGVDYTLTIYKGLSDANNPTSGTKMLEQSGTLTYSGYNTVELDEPIMVSPGEKVAVVWSFDSSTSIYVDYEYENGTWLSFTTEEKTQTSFCKPSSYSTFWYDMDMANSPMTFRIKAYTDNVGEDAKFPLESITLSKTSVVLEQDELANLTVTYNPLYTTDDTTVTWSSSDENVATVVNGVVRPVGSGTAIVTATCGTKSATCHVTVREPKVLVENKNNAEGILGICVMRVNELSNVSGVEVEVWNDDDPDNVKRYTATKQGTGIYAVDVNIADYNGLPGTYMCNAYIKYKDGTSKLYGGGVTNFTAEQVTSTGVETAVSANLETADIRVTGVEKASNVKIKVWSEAKDQDDVNWYSAENQGEGTWKVAVPLENHNYVAGTYQVEAYAGNVYVESALIGEATFTVSELTIGNVDISQVDHNEGEFRIAAGGIQGQAAVKEVKVAVWSKVDQSNLKWYTMNLQEDDTYVVNAEISKHKYEYGVYQCEVHLYGKNGCEVIETNSVELVQPVPIVTATENATGTKFVIQASDVAYGGGVDGVEIAVWSEEDGQDDLVWYTATNEGEGTWSANAELSNHNAYGVYQAEVYIVDGSGKKRLAETISFEVGVPTLGSVEISEVNHEAGKFRIIAGDIESRAFVEEVKVAVWSKADQRNLKWYTMKLQEDGTYAVNVKISKHQYEYGVYQCEVHLYGKNGYEVIETNSVELVQPVPVVTATENGAGTKFAIKASNVVYGGGVNGVKIAVWSEEGGKDDLVWYTATNKSEGVWSANAVISKHKTAGVYQAEVYIIDGSGKKRLAESTSFEVGVPVLESAEISEVNHEAGKFCITTGNIESRVAVSEVKVAVWSKEDQSNLKWYTMSLQADGTYAVNAKISKHKYEYGIYQCEVHLYDKNGMEAVATNSVELVQPVPVVTVTENGAGTKFVIKASNVAYGGGVSGVKIAVWSEEGGKDDLVWYTATNKSEGVWSANAVISKHKTAGAYEAEVYIIDGSGKKRLAESTSFEVGVPVLESAEISEVNHEAGKFRITTGNIESRVAVEEVKVAVWSKDDQSNLKWYTMKPQADGSYAVNAKISKHKYEYGIYQCEVHLYDKNGIEAVASNSVELVQPVPVVTVTENGAGTKFVIKASNVAYGGGVSGVKIAVWSEEGGKDDLVWYTATNKSEGVWSASVVISKHKTAGAYEAEVYIVDGSGKKRLAETAGFEVGAPVLESAEISEVNHEAGKFRITTGNIESRVAIEEVKVAVWSKDDQSNLVWYTMKLQEDGSYAVNAKISKHKYEYGIYQCEVHLYDKNGIEAVATNSVELVQPVPVVTIAENTAGTKYIITASDVVYGGGVSGVKVAIWSEEGDKDDLVWYTATNKSEGVWNVKVAKSKHNAVGVYQVEVYVLDAGGKKRLAEVASFEVEP